MINFTISGGKLDLNFAVEKLDASNAEAIKSAFKAKDISGANDAHIHLETLQFIDSSGVGALLSLYKTFQAQGVPVTLEHPTPSVLSVLELLRLHRIFTIKMD